MVTWEELEMSAYQSFRKSDTEWVNESANPEYERHLMDAYDASLKENGQSEPTACYWYD